MKIYVAGSSKELDRCQWAFDQVVSLGMELTMDWISAVKEEGAHPADYATKRKWSDRNIAAIVAADVFWGLVPKEEPSLGLFWEFGAARMVTVLNDTCSLHDDAGEPLGSLLTVLSGPYAAAHLFTAQADMTFASDVEGLAAVRAARALDGGRRTL